MTVRGEVRRGRAVANFFESVAFGSDLVAPSVGSPVEGGGEVPSMGQWTVGGSGWLLGTSQRGLISTHREFGRRGTLCLSRHSKQRASGSKCRGRQAPLKVVSPVVCLSLARYLSASLVGLPVTGQSAYVERRISASAVSFWISPRG